MVTLGHFRTDNRSQTKQLGDLPGRILVEGAPRWCGGADEVSAAMGPMRRRYDTVTGGALGETMVKPYSLLLFF